MRSTSQRCLRSFEGGWLASLWSGNEPPSATSPAAAASNPFASGRLTATRNIAASASGISATLTSSAQINLTPPDTTRAYVVEADIRDAWSVTLPTAFTVLVALDHAATISIGGVSGLLRNGDRATLSVGQHSIRFEDVETLQMM